MTQSVLAIATAWESLRPATCLPADCFCEGLRDGLIRQPANTWSSFAFVLAALWIALRMRGEGAARTTLSKASARLFAACLVLLGLGSAFYHASLTFLGQVLDVSGMYLIPTFVLFLRQGPRWGVSPIGTAVGFVPVNVVLMLAQAAVPSVRRVVFGVLLVWALVVGWRSSGPGRKWLAAGAGLATLAFVIWIIDYQRLACSPSSLVQGHAVWHLLGAAAAMCLFKSYDHSRKVLTA